MNHHDETRDTYKGYTITVRHYHDDALGAPWEESDGHGIIREASRGYSGYVEKKAGEIVLRSNGNSVYLYDFAGTIKKATDEGWGIDPEKAQGLTKRQIIVEAVKQDIKYCEGWLLDHWHWVGYITKIEAPDGEKLTAFDDACWGFDDEDYMIKEAMNNAEKAIDQHIAETEKEESEAEYWASRDVVTVG